MRRIRSEDLTSELEEKSAKKDELEEKKDLLEHDSSRPNAEYRQGEKEELSASANPQTGGKRAERNLDGLSDENERVRR